MGDNPGRFHFSPAQDVVDDAQAPDAFPRPVGWIGYVSGLGEEPARLRESAADAIVRRYLEPGRVLSPLGRSRSI